MTEQEFLEIISLHVETYYKVNNQRWYDNDDDVEFGLKKRAGKFLKDINLDDCILVKWCEGGITGGNCWSDDHHYSFEGEPEPAFTDLDIILEQACPKISYKDYKLLLNGVTPPLVEYGSATQQEYYGNETRYGYKKIVLRRLWERLQGLGVIDDAE